MSPDSCLSIFISQGPLQDPCLRIHVSASSNLRILCKIHVSDSCLSIHVSASIYILGSSARSMSPDSCLSIFVSQNSLQDPCLRIHGPLQDPCLRIHVSASSNLRILCKIHVSDSCLSIHVSASIYILGSSARSMSPDSCLSIFVSQNSLQDPCLLIHVSASTNMDPLQGPRLWIHVSASLYLRLLCKIHVSGSVYKHPYVSQDPLQDPCLRIHVSASICISGTSARSMSPDP